MCGERTQKKCLSAQMGFEPTTVRTLVGCSTYSFIYCSNLKQNQTIQNKFSPNCKCTVALFVNKMALRFSSLELTLIPSV